MVGTALTSFLTLGIAKFSAFLIPRVVSSRRDVCSVQNAGSSVAKQSDAPMQTQRSIMEEKKGNDQGLHDACRIAPGNAWQSRASCKHEVFDH